MEVVKNIFGKKLVLKCNITTEEISNGDVIATEKESGIKVHYKAKSFQYLRYILNYKVMRPYSQVPIYTSIITHCEGFNTHKTTLREVLEEINFPITS